ncbi:MAG: hypothetical protein ACLVJ6_06580 [Merdibacter sp.]
MAVKKHLSAQFLLHGMQIPLIEDNIIAIVGQRDVTLLQRMVRISFIMGDIGASAMIAARFCSELAADHKA